MVMYQYLCYVDFRKRRTLPTCVGKIKPPPSCVIRSNATSDSGASHRANLGSRLLEILRGSPGSSGAVPVLEWGTGRGSLDQPNCAEEAVHYLIAAYQFNFHHGLLHATGIRFTLRAA